VDFNYRGYVFPRDVLLFINVLAVLAYYSWRMRRAPLPAVLQALSEKAVQNRDSGYCTEESFNVLTRWWRACDFFLVRVLRSHRPCLMRTVVLYHWCCHNFIAARVVVGAVKQGNVLTGHSWLLIDNKPFRERAKDLDAYTVMLEI
jgi:hypothetical protein